MGWSDTVSRAAWRGFADNVTADRTSAASNVNTATLTNYANTPGGPDFVPGGITDTASVTVQPLSTARNGNGLEKAQAIANHRSPGSEASAVIRSFERLPTQQQQDVVNFLRSL